MRLNPNITGRFILALGVVYLIIALVLGNLTIVKLLSSVGLMLLGAVRIWQGIMISKRQQSNE